MKIHLFRNTLLMLLLFSLVSCKKPITDSLISLEGLWVINNAQQTAPTNADVKSSFYIQTIQLQGTTSGNYTITKPGGGTETGTFNYMPETKTLTLSKAEHGGTWTNVEINDFIITATITINASASKTVSTTANVTFKK